MIIKNPFNYFFINKKALKTFILKAIKIVCKPSSVLDGHLSRLTVSNKFKRSRGTNGPFIVPTTCTGWGLHRIFVSKQLVSSCLTFSPLPLRRFFSVALSLMSPSPAVNWHPCPIVLGLSSCLATCDHLAILLPHYIS